MSDVRADDVDAAVSFVTTPTESTPTKPAKRKQSYRKRRSAAGSCAVSGGRAVSGGDGCCDCQDSVTAPLDPVTMKLMQLLATKRITIPAGVTDLSVVFEGCGCCDADSDEVRVWP